MFVREPTIDQRVRLVNLGRSAYEFGGQEFESLRARQSTIFYDIVAMVLGSVRPLSRRAVVRWARLTVATSERQRFFSAARAPSAVFPRDFCLMR